MPRLFTQSTLSARERQVALRLGRGARVTEVAAQLGISAKTVSTYRARIFDKLGLRTTAQLMRLVLQHDVQRPTARPVAVFLRDWAKRA